MEMEKMRIPFVNIVVRCDDKMEGKKYMKVKKKFFCCQNSLYFTILHFCIFEVPAYQHLSLHYGNF